MAGHCPNLRQRQLLPAGAITTSFSELGGKSPARDSFPGRLFCSPPEPAFPNPVLPLTYGADPSRILKGFRTNSPWVARNELPRDHAGSSLFYPEGVTAIRVPNGVTLELGSARCCSPIRPVQEDHAGLAERVGRVQTRQGIDPQPLEMHRL